jgi:hypothetical protein
MEAARSRAGDKILWSKSNWWSREPVKFKSVPKESAAHKPKPSGLKRDTAGE